MRTIAVADIGGTHARFALAQIDEDGGVAGLSEPLTLRTSDHASVELAWEEFVRGLDQCRPKDFAIAFAGPTDGEVLKLTNNPWVIRPAVTVSRLGIERCTIVNDFAAVAHAVATLPPDYFSHLCGPDEPLDAQRLISIVGPGTGLGVAALIRSGSGYEVVETEGGHMDFAPLDAIEDRLLVELRARFRRVSVERVASGPGLWNIYQALAGMERQNLRYQDERELWAAALSATDTVAGAALERLCLTLGAVTGDIALAQGATAVVIAGGVGLRLAQHLPSSGFRDRFIAKGRFERRMDRLPVKVMTHPHAGLIGAAAAWAQEHRQ